MTRKLVRCAIYTRKSSEEGLEQEYNSLDAQRDACTAYIKIQSQEGWTLYAGRFDDGGISGGTMERPALKQLLESIEKDEVNVIVVYKIDRLTRSLADFARIIEILDRKGASFVSVTQQFNTTTSMGRLTLNVLLSFAQFEREVTSERIRDKIAASKKKGVWMGGYPPLSYDINNRRLVPNDKEVGVVRRIFETALEAQSLTRLETMLAADGVRAKAWRTQSGHRRGGGPLTRSALGRMLRNPVYLGKIRHEEKTYGGDHPAILCEDLWNRVQAMLDKRVSERLDNKNISMSAPLRDLVFDDRGNRMVPTYTKKKNRIAYQYYLSAPLLRGNKDNAGTIGRINASFLEGKVNEAFRSEMSVLDETIPVERLRDRISKITLFRDEIVIDVNDRSGVPKTIHVAASLERPSHTRKIYTRGGKNSQNESLIKAVAQAWGWRKALETGAYRTVKDLAKHKNLSERYVWKILRLAYLSPSIIDAILDGRQPPGLSLRQVNVTQLSPDWRSQSHALGFEAAR